jgi:hypothetical protein
MKINHPFPKIACMMLAASGIALTLQATPITGNISFSGTTTIDSANFLTATRFTSFQDVTVGAPSSLSGAYTGTTAAAVTMTPFIWAPPMASTPIHPLWSFVSGGDTYSFDLSLLSVNYISGTGLLLSGTGTAHITGPGLDYQDETGTWDFSAQTLNLSSFTFSTTTTVPPGPVPAADGGSTAALLGAACLGLGLAGRFLGKTASSQ